jgi:hydrogenase/urease accessory protein HupE
MMRILCLLALLLVAASPSAAHEVRPAYLELTEVDAETFDVLWKVPARGEGTRLSLDVRFPAGTGILGQKRAYPAANAYIERWRVRRVGGLTGGEIAIAGLEASATDVLVRVIRLDGTGQTARLTPTQTSFGVEAAPGFGNVAKTYLGLGVEHILLGFDHLLFVLVLLLLIEGWKRLVGAITAFTVAHSITLALATFGVLSVPVPPVETCIALSIAFVAAEIIHRRRGMNPLSVRQPWIVAFAFGLLHGLGFASALTDLGLPANHVPWALLFFNVGVEVGQLAFVAVALPLVFWARQGRIPVPRAAGLAVPYAIGSLAMFWALQRVAVF